MAKTRELTKAEKEQKAIEGLSKAARADYERLKKRKNVRMKGVPMWILNKDLRGGYKKKVKK